MVKDKIWYTGRLRKIYIDREFVIEKDCRCILEECAVIINSALRFFSICNVLSAYWDAFSVLFLI
ncbi:hypothetical protein ABH955_004118 [Bacillus sp. RC240]